MKAFIKDCSMINNEKRKIETYFDMEKTGKALKQDLKVFQTLSITVCTVCIIISTSEIVKKSIKKAKWLRYPCTIMYVLLVWSVTVSKKVNFGKAFFCFSANTL